MSWLLRCASLLPSPVPRPMFHGHRPWWPPGDAVAVARWPCQCCSSSERTCLSYAYPAPCPLDQGYHGHLEVGFLVYRKLFCNRFGLRMFSLNFSFSFLNFSFSRKSSEALLIDFVFSRLLILFISKYISNSALFFGLPFFALIEWNSILSAWSSVKLKSFKNCLISLMFKKTLVQSWHNGKLFINLTYKEFNKNQRKDI